MENNSACTNVSIYTIIFISAQFLLQNQNIFFTLYYIALEGVLPTVKRLLLI